MKIHSKNLIFFSVVILLSLIWFIAATSCFYSSLKHMQNQEANQKFSEIAKSNAATVNFTVNRYFNILLSTGEFIQRYDDITSDKVIDSLNTISNSNDFTRMSIDLADGLGYTSDGHVVDTRVFDYGYRTRLGKPFVLDVVNALVDDVPMVGFLIPLENKEGVYDAALRGSVPTDKLSSMLEETFVNAGGYFYVVDGSGRYVAKGTSPRTLFSRDNDYFQSIEKVSFEEGYSVAQVKELFTSRQSGIAKYSFEGEARTCYFEPVDVNHWMVITVVPDDVLNSSTRWHTSNVAIYVAQIIGIFIVLIYYIYISQKNARERAVLNEQCFKALSEHTSNVILEWDFEANQIVTTPNFHVLFGRNATTVNQAEDALIVKAVHEDDRKAFTQVFQAIRSGNAVNDARFRVIDQDGVYHRCSLSGLVIKDRKGKPFKAIGSLSSIEDQLHKEEMLRLQAEKDQLTGLYNKITTEMLIKSTLLDRRYQAATHALMMIDVDNFKEVNDKLGHLYGDMVLTHLADELKTLFRANDIVGRVGGDEFFVFLKDLKDVKILKEKAQELCKIFCITYTEKGISVSISASIGIAIAPQDGTTFEALYQNADAALYTTKIVGKNSYTLYTGQELHGYQSTRTEIDFSSGFSQ